MFNYHAPKPQLWGHRVGKLSAAQLLERSLLFLREQTIARQEAEQSLTVTWVPVGSDAATAMVERIGRSIAAPPKLIEFHGRNGERLRESRWVLTFGELPAVAAWLDECDCSAFKKEIEVLASSHVLFQWKDVLDEGTTPTPFGGMFAMYLSRPRAVTTMFGFQSMDHYRAAKQCLARIGLVTLSDKHLKEKVMRGLR